MLNKRTEQAILDDFKKIDGRVNIGRLLSKGATLLNEWLENGFEQEAIFSFGDKFILRGAKNTPCFPKEFNIVEWGYSRRFS